MSLSKLHTEVTKLGNPQKAAASARFFKTNKGEYGYGDIFLGLTVPESRAIAKKYEALSLNDLEKLLQSKFHEQRLIALLILINQFAKGSENMRKDIYALYLKNTAWINNWDLVDTSADKIVGYYLFAYKKGIAVLKKLAKSEDLWKRRIAMVATARYINNNHPQEALEIADILLDDREDLMHKAVGWMLREVGKRCSKEALEVYLKPRYKTMPRTMLRYAIEHFSPEIRKQYLRGEI